MDTAYELDLYDYLKFSYDDIGARKEEIAKAL